MNLFINSPDSSKLNCLGEGLENGNVLLEYPGSVTGGEIHGCKKQGRQNDAGHPCGSYDDAVEMPYSEVFFMAEGCGSCSG